MKTISKFAVMMSVGLGAAWASTNELDVPAVANQQRISPAALPKGMPKTLVFRVNNQTKEVEVAHLGSELKEGSMVPEGVNFKLVAPKTVMKQPEFEGAIAQLDQTSGQEGWYFYYGYGAAWGWGGGYYPRYWYGGYGYGYYPYYGYYTPYYSYYYYMPYYYYSYAYYPRTCCW